MIRLASVALVAVGLFVMNPLQGQQKIGEMCPTFDLPGVDGKNHTNTEYKKDILVICITCNHCPVAVAYEDRMIKFTKAFGTKMDFVAINVNNGEADKLPKMKERAAEKGFNFPYLYDQTQVIAKTLGATKTPQFFVYDKSRKLVYTGAMDDSQGNPKTPYLENAVTAVYEGKTPAVATTKAVGCGIQFDKSK